MVSLFPAGVQSWLRPSVSCDGEIQEKKVFNSAWTNITMNDKLVWPENCLQPKWNKVREDGPSPDTERLSSSVQQQKSHETGEKTLIYSAFAVQKQTIELKCACLVFRCQKGMKSQWISNYITNKLLCLWGLFYSFQSRLPACIVLCLIHLKEGFNTSVWCCSSRWFLSG